MLNPKKQKFADEYIKTGNAYKSAIKRGYSESTARGKSSEYLNEKEIKEYIEERMELLKDKAIADQTEILEYLSKVMRGETLEEQLVTVGTGKGFTETQVVEIKPSTREQIKAAELLGKRYRMWTDRQETETAATIIFTGEDELYE